MSEPAPVPPGNAAPDDYPRMLYHANGRTRIVANAIEHEAAHQAGWGREPLAIHQRPAVTAMPVLSGADPTALLLRAVLESVLDERGLTRSTIEQLLAAVPGAPPEGRDPTTGRFQPRR